MNRPSHWILGSLALLGATLWWTGALEDYLRARPEGPAQGTPAVRRADTPVVVRRDTAPPPAPNSEVSGRVVDRLGFPVSNAVVRVVGESASRVRTDARGRFRLTFSGAVHKWLRVEAPGVHEGVDVLGSVDPLDIVLQDALPWSAAGDGLDPAQPAGLLFGEGTVRDATGARVAGARVTVRETGATARTLDDGRYVVPLGEGRCTLVAFDGRGGYAVSATGTITRKQGKEPLPELRLESGPTLRGRLRTADGEPIVDAAVLVESGGVVRAVHTEQGGMFALAGLVPGQVELTVFPYRGHLGLRSTLAIEQDVNLNDIVLERVSQEPFRLTVLDATGTRQPFVHVVAEQLGGLSRAYNQADAEGRVVLAGLGGGEVPTFEVRRAPDLAPLRVVGFDSRQHELVVAP